AKLGRYVSHAGAVETGVRDGRVIVSGAILAHEVERCLSAIASVPGVHGIENRLHIYETLESMPGLHGTSAQPLARARLIHENWAPGSRLLVGTAGGLLAAYGAARKGPLGTALGLVGAAGLARAATNPPITHLL